MRFYLATAQAIPDGVDLLPPLQSGSTFLLACVADALPTGAAILHAGDPAQASRHWWDELDPILLANLEQRFGAAFWVRIGHFA